MNLSPENLDEASTKKESMNEVTISPAEVIETLTKEDLKKLDEILMKKRNEFHQLIKESSEFNYEFSERITKLENEVESNEFTALIRQIENKWFYLRYHQIKTEDILLSIELLQNKITRIEEELKDIDYFSDDFMSLKNELVKALRQLDKFKLQLVEQIKLGRIQFIKLQRDSAYKALLEEYSSLTDKVFPDGADLYSEETCDDENDLYEESDYDNNLYDDDEDFEEEEDEDYYDEDDEYDDEDDSELNTILTLDKLKEEIAEGHDLLYFNDYECNFSFKEDDYEWILLDRECELERAYELKGKVYDKHSQISALDEKIGNIVTLRLENLAKECCEWCMHPAASLEVKNNSFFHLRQVNKALSRRDVSYMVEILKEIKGMADYTLTEAYQAVGCSFDNRILDYTLELRCLYKEIERLEAEPHIDLIKTPKKWDAFFAKKASKLTTKNQQVLEEIEFYENEILKKMNRV